MAKLTTKLEIQSVDKVKTLIELLDKYEESLPDELLKSLKELADCDACEIGLKEIEELRHHPANVEVIVDNKKLNEVVSVNKILKRATVFAMRDGKLKKGEGKYFKEYVYPKHLLLRTLDGISIVEW